MTLVPTHSRIPLPAVCCALSLLLLLAGCRPPSAWSPDGKRIAFVYHGALYTFDTATHQFQRRNTGARQAAAPSWSPDGRQLAFYLATVSNKTVKSLALAAMDVATGKQRILEPTVPMGTPLLSVGGQKQELPGGADLVKADLDVEWRPDGKSLAYVAFAKDESALWTINADGTGAKRLPTPSNPSEPSWSPDGTMLAYVAEDGLVVSKADGGDARTLWDKKAHDGTGLAFLGPAPQWTADGKSLLVAIDADRKQGQPIAEKCEVWRVPVDGAAPEKLAKLDAPGVLLSFASRGEAAVFLSPDPAQPEMGQLGYATAPFTMPSIVARLNAATVGGPQAAQGNVEVEQFPIPALSPDRSRAALAILPAGNTQALLVLQPIAGRALEKYPIPKPPAPAKPAPKKPAPHHAAN